MFDRAQDLANLLGNPRGRAARKTTGGNWLCLCPAHSDKEPSLGIRWREGTGGDDGALLYKCYAGCAFPQIRDAIKSRGINPYNGQPDGMPSETYKRSTARKAPDRTEEEFLSKYEYAPRQSTGWLRDPRVDRRSPPGYRRTAYVYRDIDGWPLMLMYRYDRVDPLVNDKRKIMLCLTPWRHKTTGALILPSRPPSRPIPPYGAESLGVPGPVLIVEGEKCRSRLAKLIGNRLPVITPLNAHALHTDFSALISSGRRCITMPDHVNGQAFLDELEPVLGRRNTVIPSPWRLGDLEIPRGWDIADEIEGKPPYRGTHIDPLTIPDLVDHFQNEADQLHAGADQDVLRAAITALCRPPVAS